MMILYVAIGAICLVGAVMTWAGNNGVNNRR